MQIYSKRRQGLEPTCEVVGCNDLNLAIEAAACLLDLMAGILPEVLIGLTQTLDEKSVLRKQDRIGQAFTRLATIAAEAMRERMAYLGSAPDPGPVLHTLLGLTLS